MFVFPLPEIGEGVVEGEIVRWLVNVGDTVATDQPLCEIMTDKATIEIPSPFHGVCKSTNAKEGETVHVGQVHVQQDQVGPGGARGGQALGGGGGLDKPSYFTRDGAIDRELQILPGRPIPDPIWNTALGLGFVWQLDIWRQLRNARDSAMRRYVAAREKRNYQVTKTVAEIADIYYRLMALDKRIENLDMTIRLQQKSLEFSNAVKDAGRGTELPVQRFLAEVNRNQSQKLIVRQDIIQAENRITVARNRYIKSVEEFNVTVRTFPNNLTAMVFGYKPKPQFAVDDEKAIAEPPKVQFGGGAAPAPAPAGK